MMIIKCAKCESNMTYLQDFDYPDKNGYYCDNFNCKHEELDTDLNEEVIADQFKREVPTRGRY